MINRTREILKSAHKYSKTLERVVILGSAVSVLNSFEDITKEGKPYTEKDWNPVRLNGYLGSVLSLISSIGDR